MQIDKDSKVQISRLSSDVEYYNNVFKKVEKILSVTFYVLSETNKTDSIEFHINAIKDRALKTHDQSLRTLELQPHQRTAGLVEFQYALVAFESTLQVANAAAVIPSDIFSLLIEQLDQVQRYLNHHYLTNTGFVIADLHEVAISKRPSASSVTTTSVPTKPATPSRQKRVAIPAGDISSDAYLVYSQLTDRAERIKTVLEAKPQASVKDIAEIITDVSEKTIQRELNSLIEKGQVVREGEKRWSKYSVVK